MTSIASDQATAPGEPAPAKERRKGRASTQRRPRFLARRRTGDLGLRLVIGGEEIIARG